MSQRPGLDQPLGSAVYVMVQQHPTWRTDKQKPVQPSPSLPLMSQVAHQFPEPVPVVLKVQLGATPVATLHTNSSTLKLQPFVEVLAASPNSALQFLFSLDVVSDRPGGIGWIGEMLSQPFHALCFPHLLCIYPNLSPELAAGPWHVWNSLPWVLFLCFGHGCWLLLHFLFLA